MHDMHENPSYKAGSDGTLTWNGTNASPEYVELFSNIIDSKNPEEYAETELFLMIPGLHERISDI